MWFSAGDASAVGRCLAQVADEEADVIDLFLERRSQFELRSSGPGPGLVERSDAGLAVRLVRDGRSYLSARDGFAAGTLEAALKEVSRVSPSTAYRVPDPRPREAAPFSGEETPERLAEFPASVASLVRRRHSAFDFHMRLGHYRRAIQLVGRRLVPDQETEAFFSVEASTPWGRFGSLSARLDDRWAEELASQLTARFHARSQPPLARARGPLVLGPSASAVLLHEAVAHALEADTLVLSGRPAAAIGVRLGSDALDVFDSPGDLPAPLRRTTDDEGMPVLRRWLLQKGRVNQPLADRFYAGLSSRLLPGAGRRASRHLGPVPRSTHLELAAGASSERDLLAGRGGIYFPEISRGRLDPLSGELTVAFPYGRRFRSGQVAEWVGPCTLTASAAEILGAIVAVGDEPVFAGAGWCAKGGQRLPVWATSPPIRLEGVAVGS